MSDAEAETIVRNYFRRLEAVLSDVPQDRREQLIGELRDHVSQARATLEVESIAAIHEILERIGSPEEIAAEESTGSDNSSGILRHFLLRQGRFGHRTMMSENNWSLLGVTAGFVFVLAFLVSMFIAPSAP